MKKLGKILLLILNIFIDIFLLALIILLALWMFVGIDPQQSVHRSFVWIENSWHSLWGTKVEERALSISPKFRERAHKQIYVVSPNKRDESAQEIITQPYK